MAPTLTRLPFRYSNMTSDSFRMKHPERYAKAVNVPPGYHELEILEMCQNESDLHQKRDDCTKNPQHTDFIPVGDFNENHLPEGHRDKLCLNYIKAVIDLTVRLVMSFVSLERPGNGKYPLFQDRGKHTQSYGSGRVANVKRKYEDMDGQNCPCPKCTGKPDEDRRKQWGKYEVVTAKHVVFNHEESRSTVVNLDYNEDSDRDTCLKLYGVEVEYSNIEEDWCDMNAVSHDRDVCLMLEERVECYKRLRDELDLDNKNKQIEEPNKVPIVCVSHPHGMSKHVTVGEFRGRQEYQPHKWRYTTSTCPGSSGAPVFGLGNVVEEAVYPGVITHHSGRNKDLEDTPNESGMFGLYR